MDSSSSSSDEDGERREFQNSIHASLRKMRTGENSKRHPDDEDDLFDTVLSTYKKHCSQARADKFSAPKAKRTESEKKKNAEKFAVSFSYLKYMYVGKVV